MSRRTDLLELTTEALMALTNPGFVKRALKELADGQMPAIEQDTDGTVRARYADQQCATLPPGRSVREAACTCPASGLCRHRVTLVLAYQRFVQAAASTVDENIAQENSEEAVAWTPAHFDDRALADSLPSATLELAARLAAARPVIRVVAWQADAPVPTAHLPMCSVRFFSRSSLLHARCDCKKGSACEHVALAVWAFRQAQPSLSVQTTIELRPAAQSQADAQQSAIDVQLASLAADLDALLLQLWLDGSSQPPIALEARFDALRSRVEAWGWCWLVEAIDEVRLLLAAQHARSSEFDPARLLQALAQLPARVFAARHAEQLSASGAAASMPASQILGLGVKGEVALDHLRLISLGAECWRDDRSEGLRIAFVDPDSLAITVFERSWPIAAATPAIALMARRIASQSVRQLAASQIVTKGAKRRANGLISIAAATSQTSVLPLSTNSWDTLGAPVRQIDGRALMAHLNDAAPDFVRAKQTIEHLHVLPITRVLDSGWDAATQTLHARVLAASDQADSADSNNDDFDAADVVLLSLPHQVAAPDAVDAMARVLASGFGAPRFVAGMARIEAGRVCIKPIAFLTAQRAVVLQAEPAARQTLQHGIFENAPSALANLVDATRDLLISWLRQGLRHQGTGALTRGKEQADALRHAGLSQTGDLLQAIVDEIRGNDRKPLPNRIAQLTLLLDGISRTATASD
jgi:hypothetical protein